ncbi:MAG: hypothetical protein MHPSP_003038, partial [Paramarteilia canceri]
LLIINDCSGLAELDTKSKIINIIKPTKTSHTNVKPADLNTINVERSPTAIDAVKIRESNDQYNRNMGESRDLTNRQNLNNIPAYDERDSSNIKQRENSNNVLAHGEREIIKIKNLRFRCPFYIAESDHSSISKKTSLNPATLSKPSIHEYKTNPSDEVESIVLPAVSNLKAQNQFSNVKPTISVIENQGTSDRNNYSDLKDQETREKDSAHNFALCKNCEKQMIGQDKENSKNIITLPANQIFNSELI